MSSRFFTSHHRAPGHRVFPLDLLKAVAMVAVVSFHGGVVPSSAYQDAYRQVDCLLAPLRFCVPLLFTISFFLLRRGLEKKGRRQLLLQRLGRLLMPMLVWFSLAMLMRYLAGAPLLLPLLQGRSFPGAYYLIAMVLLLPLFIWRGPQLGQLKGLLLCLGLQLGVVCWLAMVQGRGAAGASALSGFGRPFPGYWLAYMALGSYLYDHYGDVQTLSTQMPAWTKGLLLTAISGLLAWEYQGLWGRWAGHPRPFEYAMVSCIFSVPVLFVCAAGVRREHLPPWLSRVVEAIATYSLGIFCINGILSLVIEASLGLLLGEQQLPLEAVLPLRLMGTLGLLTLSFALSRWLEKQGLGSWVR